MIIVKNEQSSLRIYFEVGLNESGNPIYRSKTYSRVKPDTTQDDIFAVAGIISDLQTLPVGRVNRADQADLEQG